MARVATLLGPERQAIVQLVLGDKLTLEDAAEHLGMLGVSAESDAAAIETLRLRLVDALDILANEYGLDRSRTRQ